MKLIVIITLVHVCLMVNLHATESVIRGKVLSTRCVTCHGFEGRSSNPLWPNLSGQSAAYLIKQLKAFKSGQRNNALMKVVVADLTNQNIEDLAVYFSTIKPRAL